MIEFPLVIDLINHIVSRFRPGDPKDPRRAVYVRLIHKLRQMLLPDCFF